MSEEAKEHWYLELECGASTTRKVFYRRWHRRKGNGWWQDPCPKSTTCFCVVCKQENNGGVKRKVTFSERREGNGKAHPNINKCPYLRPEGEALPEKQVSEAMRLLDLLVEASEAAVTLSLDVPQRWQQRLCTAAADQIASAYDSLSLALEEES